MILYSLQKLRRALLLAMWEMPSKMSAQGLQFLRGISSHRRIAKVCPSFRKDSREGLSAAIPHSPRPLTGYMWE